jgi:hypothetical protein
MKKNIPALIVIMCVSLTSHATPPCTALGDQTTYGTNNVWIGYAYQGKTFTTYMGYVTEGTAASPNFDESFGGDQVNYSTNGCPVYTENFAMRYKLTKSFTDADYIFTVGADDGYRLSLDGGTTWAINNWNDHGYTTSTYSVHLNGTYNMVLEYYENGGGNRVSFNVVATCAGSGDPSVYGTSNVWQAYIYSGTNFTTYKGHMTEGTALNSNFDENFGGDNVTYNTSDCPITTELFSVRYRLQKSFTNGTYTFVVGGDDGYRLSLDGGSTWIINKWNAQSYVTTTLTTVVNGTKSMVLEYFENTGQNRISFNLSGGTILPVQLMSFDVKSVSASNSLLTWQTATEMNTEYFNVQRSEDGYSFRNLTQVTAQSAGAVSNSTLSYSFADNSVPSGIVYYRLEFMDRDGHHNYSDVIKLSGAASSQSIKMFPTVVNHTGVFIETAKTIKNARLEIFDLMGKKMSETNWDSLNGKQALPYQVTGKLTTGTYVVRVTAQGENLYNQLLIIQ